MAHYFLDSSALLKRYLEEENSERIREATDPKKGKAIYIAQTTGVEVIATFARASKRFNRLSPVDAEKLKHDFIFDEVEQYIVVSITSDVMQEAQALADNYALRGYDAIQLASAKALERALREQGAFHILISGDDELNEAAEAEGLKVEKV
jgi:hypothetical protein